MSGEIERLAEKVVGILSGANAVMNEDIAKSFRNKLKDCSDDYDCQRKVWAVSNPQAEKAKSIAFQHAKGLTHGDNKGTVFELRASFDNEAMKNGDVRKLAGLLDKEIAKGNGDVPVIWIGRDQLGGEKAVYNYRPLTLADLGFRTSASN